MRRPVIDEPNRYLVAQQRNFRAAANVIATVFSPFSEIEAIALIGSVAKTLWKAVPRFREFRRAGIEVWHERFDVDLAVWITSQHRLGALRRVRDLALRSAYEASPLPMRRARPAIMPSSGTGAPRTRRATSRWASTRVGARPPTSSRRWPAHSN